MRRVFGLPRTLLLLLLGALLLLPGGALAQAATPAAGPAASPAGARPLPLTGDRRAAFEAYVAQMLAATHVPGAAVAVVEGGQVVELNGFGVRTLGQAAPVTPDTLMMIGSTQKSMTSLLAATLVDDGTLRWDTPLTDLLPGFATADPALTKRLTVADAFCMCTGIPQRDWQFVVPGSRLSPEQMIASLATMPPTAPFGQKFQYTNQLYAAGGYALAAAAGGQPGGLAPAYESLLRQRVLGPLGMARSTFDFAAVQADGDYATPHAPDLGGAYVPLSLVREQNFVGSVVPAGGLWSSARELARYLLTQLGEGVAPDGARVVSAANLAVTRQQRVAGPPGAPVPLLAQADAGYALGWVVGSYHGRPLLSHSGATLGFSAEVALWPAAGLGLVVLANGVGADLFTLALQFRLAELAFGQAPEIAPLIAQVLAAGAQQTAATLARLGARVDPAAVAPALGRYANPLLGAATLAFQGDRLILTMGDVRSALRPLHDATGKVVAYVTVAPPFAGVPITFPPGPGGAPTLVFTAPATQERYAFARASGPATPPA